MKTIQTTVHAYKFDTRDSEEKKAYKALRKQLTAMGLRVFETHGHERLHYQIGRELDGRTIELETRHLFKDQWNTAPIAGISENGYRVFDWAQDYLPNRDPYVKQGYWLEQTADMRAVRENTEACGYCGKQEPAGTYAFCPHCMGSEYLEKADLFLLRMKRVSDPSDRAPLTDSERETLEPIWREAKIKGITERDRQRLAETRAAVIRDAERAIRNAETERDGMLYLLDRGFRTYNVIYYNHTGRFSFGWQTKVCPAIEAEIIDIMGGFPFPYDIHCEDGRTISSDGTQQ